MAPNADNYGYRYRCRSSDRRRHRCHDAQYPSNYPYESDYPFSTSTATQATDSAPTSATLVNGSSNSLNPIAVIVPTIVGAALLILGVGAFLLWRRKRRAAAAAAAGEETRGMRGGGMAGVDSAAAAAAAAAEKVVSPTPNHQLFLLNVSK
ncbi:hypothetical protein BDD12DRAFT_861676 [Trichophaea hybrida]|nr:hypothetical protein BDD12DRAFT_861676 [Trichophaea hybrida]